MHAGRAHYQSWACEVVRSWYEAFARAIAARLFLPTNGLRILVHLLWLP
jgi:hypothetical protein